MNKDLCIKIGITFYICSFLGYLYEFLVCLIMENKIINPGFLKGPWLPIYGIGGIILSFLKKFKKHPFKVFCLSFFLTGFLEFICGEIFVRLFHIELWNYQNNFLNIDGQVCLLSAFVFGIGGILTVYLLNPLINKIYNKINNKKIIIILVIISTIFSFDLIATLNK